MDDDDSGRSTPSGRVERYFARLGIVALAIALVALVLAIDVLLTSRTSRAGLAPRDDFSLVTDDGRELGWTSEGLQLRFSPGTVYENAPDQDQPPYRVNSYGLRGAELRDDADRRVVVVGGSAAFGLGVAEAQTFPVLLEQRIEGHEVLNAGVIGFLTGQEVGLALSRLLDLEPDVIIAFNGWNDVYDAHWWSVFGDGRKSPPGVNVTFRMIENRLLALRRIEHEPGTALMAATRSLVRNSTLLSTMAGWLSRPQAPPLPELPAELLDDAVATYVANMRKLDALARGSGARLLVVVQPELGQLLDASAVDSLRGSRKSFDWGDYYWARVPSLYAGFRERVVPALAASGVTVIDASRLLGPRGAAAGRWFNDPVHLNPAGHRRVAELLATELTAGE